MILIWMLATAFTTFGKVRCHQDQEFAIEPQNQTVVVGSHVTLPCRIINRSGIVQWTKNDFGLGPYRTLPAYDRYRMIGIDEEGEYSLYINPVKLYDEGKYQCQVSAGSQGQKWLRSQFAWLTVLSPPDDPVIAQGNMVIVIEGMEVEFLCVATGGKPAANMTWMDGNGDVLTEGTEYVTEYDSYRETFTAKLYLKILPRRCHNNEVFTCQAKNEADKKYRSTNLKFLVEYAPEVKLQLLSAVGPFEASVQGADIVLFCQVDAQPEVSEYKWYIDGEIVFGEETSKLVIRNATQRLHGATVECKVRNAIGESADSKTLEITYGPKFRTKPTTIETDLGATVTLSCDAEGNPQPEIVWIRKDTGQIVGRSTNWTVRVSHDLGGEYQCKASVPGFPEIQTGFALLIKGKPTIISSAIQFCVSGQLCMVECLSICVPAPDKVYWTSEKLNFDASPRKYSIVEDKLSNGVIKSTLLIYNSKKKHFGIYKCSVENTYGISSTEIELKETNGPSTTFAPMIFIAISAVGIVVTSIPLIIFYRLYHMQKMIPVHQKKDQSFPFHRSDSRTEFATDTSVNFKPNLEVDDPYGNTMKFDSFTT